MDISDIIVLIKAGYTKADIDAMNAGNLVDQKDKTEIKAELETEGNLVEQKNQTESSVSVPISAEPVLISTPPKVEVNNSEIGEKLDRLINLIQKQAILNSNIPDIPNLTLEDVAASIIDPNSARRNEVNGK